jgi:hypothetical protein
MIFRLWLHLLRAHALVLSAAPTLYQDVVTVVADAPPLFDGEDGRVRTLALILEWAARESGGSKSAIGAAGDCRRGQLLFPAARAGHTCAELAEPGTLDLELTLAWMRQMRDVCGGNVRQGLAAYARGSCTSTEGLAIADRRLAELRAAMETP